MPTNPSFWEPTPPSAEVRLGLLFACHSPLDLRRGGTFPCTLRGVSPTIQHLDVPTPDGAADAVLARPEGGGTFPGVLFLMDAIGLRPVIEGMAGRLAGAGLRGCSRRTCSTARAGRRSSLCPTSGTRTSARRTSRGLMPIMRGFTPELQARDGGRVPRLSRGAREGRRSASWVTAWAAAWPYAPRRPTPTGSRRWRASTAATSPRRGDDSPHRGLDRVRGEVYVGHAGRGPFHAAGADGAA